MAKIDHNLLERMRKDPQAKVNLIVRTKGDPEEYIPLLSQRGIEVRQKIQLLKALAIRAPASQCLLLLDEGWVLAIEEDRPVKAHSA